MNGWVQTSATPMTLSGQHALIHLSRLLIGGILLVSAVTHLQTPFRFLDSVLKYELVSGVLGRSVAILIPHLQLIVASCLLCGIFLRGSLGLAGLLFALFAFAQSSVLVRGMTIDCGCLGGVHHPVSFLGVSIVSVLCFTSFWAYCCLNRQANILLSSIRGGL
jgi:hypothetical protein